MLDSKLVSVFKKYDGVIDTMHFSDQYTGPKPTEVIITGVLCILMLSPLKLGVSPDEIDFLTKKDAFLRRFIWITNFISSSQ